MKILSLLFGGIVAAFLSLKAKRDNSGAVFTVPSIPDSPIVDAPSTIDAQATASPGVDITHSNTITEVIDMTVENVKDVAAAVKNTIFGTKYDALILSSANQYGIDPALLYRLLNQESRFREDIITGKTRSSVGALGIAQFMPATAIQELGSINAALDPERAIPGAARYLAKLIRLTGSIPAGVAAYNWGIGNVQRRGLKKAPSETVNYVLAITGDNIKV